MIIYFGDMTMSEWLYNFLLKLALSCITTVAVKTLLKMFNIR